MRHQRVERIAQDRHDWRRTLASQPKPAQVDRLELDRVLTRVRKLAGEQIAPPTAPKSPNELMIGGHRAQRCRVGFPSCREVANHWRVTRPQNDIQVSRCRLGERFVRPAIRWGAAMQIDVWCNHAPERRRLSIGARPGQCARPIGIEVRRRQHLRQRLQTIGIGAPGVNRRSSGLRPKRRAPLLEAVLRTRSLQKAAFVEPAEKAAQLTLGDRRAAQQHRVRQLRESALAVQ